MPAYTARTAVKQSKFYHVYKDGVPISDVRAVNTDRGVAVIHVIGESCRLVVSGDKILRKIVRGNFKVVEVGSQ